MTSADISPALHERAMLVSLERHMWQAVKQDKAITDETASRYGTTNKDLQVKKRIIAAERLDGVKSALWQAYELHRKLTLPWNDDGTRIITTDMYFDYTQGMQKIRVEAFEPNFEAFMVWYEAERENLMASERERLNGAFNADDYPLPWKARKRFGLEWQIFPMPHVDDFRLVGQSASIDALKADLARNLEMKQKEAVAEIYRRLREAVANLNERMGDQKGGKRAGKAKVFRDTLTTNLVEVVEAIPKLNFTDDPDLTALYTEITKKLCPVSADQLRANPEARRVVKRQSKAILKKLDDYFEF